MARDKHNEKHRSLTTSTTAVRSHKLASALFKHDPPDKLSTRAAVTHAVVCRPTLALSLHVRDLLSGTAACRIARPDYYEWRTRVDDRT